MKKTLTQAEWIERARAVLPGAGFGNFDPNIVIRNGNGSRVWDENGKEYVDYLIGSGPMLLGHGNEEVQEAIFEQIPKGMTFFANNALGIELAEEICRAVPCADQLRYVSTGGEADMYAMRLARAATGREKILKFEGGYHGMSAEAQMSLAPSKLANFPQPVPDSAGIPEAVRDSVWAAPFNDIEFLRSFMTEHGDEIAGVIVEPLQRIVPPVPGFLAALREECDKHGIVLIFDEVVTGFRFDYGGAQALYGVTPDVATLGKVIGGGFPLAAIVGSEEIMRHFDKSTVGPDKWSMQLGTLSGNPVASAAGLKTLEILRREGNYTKLRKLGGQLKALFETHLKNAGATIETVGDDTLFDIVFTDKPVRNYRDVHGSDSATNARFNSVLREQGIFKSPGKTYPSLALTPEDLAMTDAAIKYAANDI
ncbi:MAG: aminotransferase class III-fold pyridoxal phosphate-dependent enzyme [Pseudomonadota bacterium]